jgi:hypothetical protein
MDLTMHRVTEEHGLIESANGSIAKDTQPLRSTTISRAATSALTKCAFSWKFVLDLLLRNGCRNARETLVL